MAIELNVGSKSNIDIQTAADSTNLQPSNLKTSTKILNGESLKVTSGAMSDLEKLVAQLKTETDGAKMSVTQRRISVLQTVLDSISDRITEKERSSLIKIEELNGEKSEVMSELSMLEADKASIAGRITELDVKISALENAAARAVEEGEDHREQVAKLKAKRAEEQKKLDHVNTAIASANAKISEIDVKIATCTKSIAQTTLNEVANALRIAANGKSSSSASLEDSSDMSNAERVEADKKAEATDIGNVIRDALDKIDEQINKTLDEAQVVKA